MKDELIKIILDGRKAIATNGSSDYGRAELSRGAMCHLNIARCIANPH